jgi:Kef-type K+ transport system membrane component KefB
MERADKWTAPLFIFFFVISGAELELSVFGEFTTMLIGIIYVLSRAAGKYFGAYAGCKITNQNKKVTQNLGIALFPQAGVALGMVSTVCSDGLISSETASVVRFVILFAVLVYEIFGPVATKWALTRAGDITEKPADSSRRKINLPHFDRHEKHHQN